MPTRPEPPPPIYCGVCRAPNSIENQLCEKCGAAMDLATPTMSSTSNIASLLIDRAAAPGATNLETAQDPTASVGYKGYWLLVGAVNTFNLVTVLTTPAIHLTSLPVLIMVLSDLAAVVAVGGILLRKRWGVVLIVLVVISRAIAMALLRVYFPFILSDLLSLVVLYVILKSRWPLFSWR